MGDDDKVTEALCRERRETVKKFVKIGDKHLEDWLSSLDGKFWAVIFLTISSLLASVGTLVAILLKAGGKG